MSSAPPLPTQPGSPTAFDEVLDLEALDAHTHRGTAHATPGSGRMFGGEVAGQALAAAHRTVPADRPVHSLHAYFLLGGRPDVPVDYRVDDTRDGGSFTTRFVRAEQEGATIFVMAASFQREETSIEHQLPVLDVTPPDESATVADLLDGADPMTTGWLHWMSSQYPWEVRFPERPPAPGEVSDGPRRTWFRSRGPLPDDTGASHAAALAHGSDLTLLGSAIQLHGKVFGDPKLFVTSLDHTIWFHEQPRVDEWLLYDARSSWAGGGRALCRGRFFSADGTLVATVAQEGLVRTG